MNFVYLENGLVVDRVGNYPHLLFRKEYADMFIEAPEGVEQGWTFIDDEWQAPKKTTEQIIAEYDRVLTIFLDSKAKEKNYDNRITCALRAGFKGPFQEECTRFAVWMDNSNVVAYKIMNDISAGTIEPLSIEEFIDSLPKFQW
jgi:hypothetical protein